MENVWSSACLAGADPGSQADATLGDSFPPPEIHDDAPAGSMSICPAKRWSASLTRELGRPHFWSSTRSLCDTARSPDVTTALTAALGIGCAA